MKPSYLIKHSTVTETIEGEKVSYTLPTPQAEVLYNKLVKIGAEVTISLWK